MWPVDQQVIFEEAIFQFQKGINFYIFLLQPFSNYEHNIYHDRPYSGRGAYAKFGKVATKLAY